MYEYAARLIRLVDADTLILDIDLGMNIWLNSQRIRLAGLNAPELATDEGKAAAAWVRDWLTRHAYSGTVTIRTQKDRSDNYGRLLATVAAQDGAVLNSELLAAGHADVWPKPSPRTP